MVRSGVDFHRVPAVPTSLICPARQDFGLFATSHTKLAGWRADPAREPLRAGFWDKRVRRVYKKERRKENRVGEVNES